MMKEPWPLYWHSVEESEKPELGERVLIVVGDFFVCEGFMKANGKWYRYDDIYIDVETMFSEKVTEWANMPLSTKGIENLRSGHVARRSTYLKELEFYGE